MDSERFDNLARVLGVAFSRQSVFRVLAGVGAAGLAALTGLNPAEGKKGNGDGVYAEKRGKGGKRKHRRKRKRRRKHRNLEEPEKLCPSNQDVVCHCPPGNTDNCQTTGNGGGHTDHRPLDCCCTINGVLNPLCTCPERTPDGSFCCKPENRACANDSQCCGGNSCCNIVDGIGACQPVCCVPLTCADYPGQCGPQDDGCGGQTANCACPGAQSCCAGVCVTGGECCEANDCDPVLCQTAACNDGNCDYTPIDDGDQGPLCNGGGEFCCNGDDCCDTGQVCTTTGCCTPLTCADFPGQCGAIDDGCQGDLSCACPGGQGCCDGVCTAGAECCASEDCAVVICQVATCNNGACDYTPVDDNLPGPECRRDGQFCCNGSDCCEAEQVCTSQGCCTPNTCADFPGQCGALPQGCGLSDLDCACANGTCCAGECIEADQCCAASDCLEHRCQIAACTDHACEYTPVSDNEPGPLCDDNGLFCCNGDDCCGPSDVCTERGCCTPLTCADFPNRCGPQPDGCDGQTESCVCTSGECCGEVCITGDQCCAVDDCPEQLCQNRDCVDHECDYTPVNDGQQGTLCDGGGQFCCAGDLCCEAGTVCFFGECCLPLTQQEACADAGVICGPVSDGCGSQYDCGVCSQNENCIAGVCKAAGGKRKRCNGRGLTGQPCKGKKCKCKGSRRCHHGKCCETVGDGSRHCNADSDCCPGLACVRKGTDQHKVCLRKPTRQQSSEATP